MEINSAPILTLTEILAALANAVALSGSQANWCAAHEVSTAYLSDVLRGRREPGKKILDVLGYEAVTFYQSKA